MNDNTAHTPGPCPFCNQAVQPAFQNLVEHEEGNLQKVFTIHHACPATKSEIWCEAETKEAAHAIWNRAQAENERLTALNAELVEALKFIRFNWAGHSEACASVDIPGDKCDCDWPIVRDKCDAALSKAEVS